MKIVGLDLSMNSSGCVSWEIGKMDKTFKFLGFTHTVKWSSKNILSYSDMKDSNRYDKTNWFIDKISDFCNGADVIAVEDFAYSASGMVFDIGEFCGQVKLNLYNQGYNLFLVPPTVHKKFLTGNGKADKVKTTDVAREKFPATTDKEIMALKEYESPSCDIYDAFSIALVTEAKVLVSSNKGIMSNYDKKQQEVLKSVSSSNKIPFWNREFLKKQ